MSDSSARDFEVEAEVIEPTEAVDGADVLESTAIVLEKMTESVGFGIDKASGKPRIIGIDKMHEDNMRVKDMLEAYEYTGEDEERKKNSRFLAALRKYKTEVSKAAKTWKADYFSEFDSDVKVVSEDADEMIAIAQRRKKESEDKFKSERMAVLREQFEGTAVMDENLDGLDIESFMDDSWLNRSTTEKSARAALEERIRVFDDAVALGIMEEYSLQKKALALDMNGWDVTKAMTAYAQDMQAKADAEALRKQREEEKQRREAEKASMTVVRLSVPNKQLDEFWSVLDEAGIEYRKLG